MPRQRWRKTFKSFIDPRKDEQLTGFKNEIDGKVKKIYDLIGDDRKEELADVIGDFQKQYESLYARYNNLTGELRKKFRSKSGRDNSSTSSDSSDSDDYAKRNGEVEIDVEENSSVSEREELERKLAAAVAEKEALHREYQSALKSKNDDFSSLLEENAQLRFRNSEMEKALVEKENEFSDLQKRFGDRESELSERITTLTADVNNLRAQLCYTSDQKGEADKQIEIMKDRNTQLESKIVEQEIEMQEQRDEFSKSSEEHKRLEVNLVLSEKKLEDISDHFRESMAAKNQETDELKSKLEMKDDEITSLMENLRATEIKCVKLEERTSMYEKAQMNLVAEISEKVNGALMGIHTLSVKFEEVYGNLHSRIDEIGTKLKVVVNWITVNNAEKDELKKKIEELEMKLLNKEDEKKRLAERVREEEEKKKEMEMMIEERDEKVGELERNMKEKDGGILSLSEEKREAIRQLCIWIDFHHDRYQDLKDMMILKKRGGRREISA